jgi:U3 small nucleolar RNA-associated protein 10
MLPSCLNAMTDCVNDDALLKSINLGVLMHTRSEDPRLRLFALICSEALWRAHGGKLIGLLSNAFFAYLCVLTELCPLGFVPETTSFMAECAEDEHDNIVKQSHQLKNAVEIVAGNIDGI